MGTDLNSKELDILRALADAARSTVSAKEILYQILGIIGRQFGWSAGRITTIDNPDSEGETVVYWESPIVNELQIKNYPLQSELLRASIGTGQFLFIADPWSSDLWPGYLSQFNDKLRGYAALPIYAGNVWTTILELFTTNPLVHDPSQPAILTYASTLAGLVIERGNVQSQLRESERRFRGIFDQSYHFIALCDPDGILLDINETTLRFGGVKSEEVIGLNLWETPWWSVSVQSQEKLRSSIAMASTGRSVRYESAIWGGDGQVIIVDLSIRPIRNRKEDIVLLILEARDITELRRALDRIQETEHRLEEAQRIAHIGHWEYAVAEEQSLFSESLLEIFGLDPHMETPAVDLLMARIHPEDQNGLQRLLFRSFNSASPFNHHFRITRSDGEVRWVFMAGNTVVGENGQPLRMAGIVQDVSGRRQLENSLAHSIERLSGLNQMGQAVASTIDLPSIYHNVLSTGRRLLHADAVVLFSHTDKELVITAVEQQDDLGLLGRRIPEDAGIAGEVWQTGEAVWLSGEACRRRRSSMLVADSGHDPNSIIAVPVRWQDEIIGILEATNSDEHTFEADDVDMLQAIANWTAIAIGKAEQHHAIERRLRESDAIASISRALGETLEPHEILEMIVTTAHEIVPRSDWAVIHLLRGRPERLEPAAVAGTDADLSGYIIGPEEGIAGLALQEGYVINSGNTETDPRASYFAHTVGLHSLLVAPILTRNKRLGTITLHCSQPHAFSDEDERLLTILAAQAGLSIENAYLFDSQRRARLVAELQRERLRVLAGRIVTAQEEERLRISRELHDEAGQALTSIKISLDLIRQGLPSGLGTLRDRLSDLAVLTGETMETLRTLAHDLRPPGLDAFGLNVALEGLCHDFSVRTGLLVVYNGIDLPGVPTTIALPMYRFAQEALTNIAKHAEASQISVSLSRSDGIIHLLIADDGKGFIYDPDSRHQNGIGLVSMQERTDLIGGTLEIETSPGNGTRITAHFPDDPQPSDS